MIKKWYEVSCDKCGSAVHFGGTMRIAKKSAIEEGWLFVGKYAFCSEQCKQSQKVVSHETN